MKLTLDFILLAAGLGVSLAMDAFSVSLANGLHYPGMPKKKMLLCAGVFAFFQALMPLLGWVCVHTVVQYFGALEKCVPWVAFGLLGYLGVSMLLESRKDCEEEACPIKTLGFRLLLTQGIATSIDALAAGFTISEYGLGMALLCVGIIAALTFVICMAGLYLGKKFGTKLAGKASILGGVILIAIGLKIFIEGVFC